MWARGAARWLDPARSSAARLLPPTDATQASEFFSPWALEEEELSHGRAYDIIPSVYRAVDQIKGDVASLPLMLYRKQRNGERERVEEHPFLEAWRHANDGETDYDIVEGVQGSLDLNGNAYLLLERAGGMLEFDFQVLPAHLTRPKFTKDGELLAWVVRYPGRAPFMFLPEEVIHFRYWNWRGGWAGMAPISAAALSYKTQRLQQRWTHGLYLRGGEPAYALEGEFGFDKAKQRRMEQLVKARYSRGPDGTFESTFYPQLLPPNTKRVQTSLTPDQLKVIDQYKLTKQDIYEVYQIPPWMVGVKESGGLGQGEGSKTDERLYWRNCIGRRCGRIARTLNEFLLPRWGEDLELEFDLSDVHPLKLERLEIAKECRLVTGRYTMTVNEYRTEYQGLPADPNPASDELSDPLAVGPALGASGDPPKASAPAGSTRAALARAHLARLTRFERPFMRIVVAMFDDQEERVLRDAGVRDRRDYAGDDFAESEQDFERIVAALRRIVETRGAEALAEALVELDYSMSRQEVQRYIERQADRMLTGTSDTTRRMLREQIAQVKATGGGDADVVRAIREVFMDRRENAATIARTEVAPAYNFATLDAWTLSGEVEQVEWVTILDGHEREAHREADGQIVPLGQPFMVDGEALSFPGDPMGSVGNVANCRCGIQAHLSARERSLPVRGGAVAHSNGNGKISNRLKEYLANALAR